MLDRERACKKVGPSVAILDPVHDAKDADSQVRTVWGVGGGIPAYDTQRTLRATLTLTLTHLMLTLSPTQPQPQPQPQPYPKRP
jgi:hypothetical protein